MLHLQYFLFTGELFIRCLGDNGFYTWERVSEAWITAPTTIQNGHKIKLKWTDKQFLSCFNASLNFVKELCFRRLAELSAKDCISVLYPMWEKNKADFHPHSTPCNNTLKNRNKKLHLQCFSRTMLHVLFLKYVDNATVTQGHKICEPPRNQPLYRASHSCSRGKNSCHGHWPHPSSLSIDSESGSFSWRQ